MYRVETSKQNRGGCDFTVIVRRNGFAVGGGCGRTAEEAMERAVREVRYRRRAGGDALDGVYGGPRTKVMHFDFAAVYRAVERASRANETETRRPGRA